jgi:hypothetical protein
MVVTDELEPKNWLARNQIPVYLVVALILPPLGLILALNWFLKQRNQQSTKPMRIILGVLAASIAGILIYAYAYSNWSGSGSNNSGTNLSSSQLGLSTYKLSGAGAGKGISFLKPAALSSTSDKNNNSVSLVSADKTNPKLTNAGIDVTAYPVTGQYNSTFNLASVLSKPDTPQYRAFTLSAENYLKERVHYLFYQGGNLAAVSLETSKPAGFTNANLDAKNTWKFSFSASYFKAKGSALPAALDRTVNGEMILAYSKGTYYYFIVSAETGTWQANQQVWPLIINSVKIDQ